MNRTKSIKTLGLLIALFGLLLSNKGYAQEDVGDDSMPKFVRLNVDLSDGDFRNLRHLGRLRMQIPHTYRNKIAAVQLRYISDYQERKVRVNGEPRVRQNGLNVNVDELMLERLKFQPIEFRVFEKNFDHVEIVLVHVDASRIFVAEDNRNLTTREYRIVIQNQLELIARIGSEETLELKSDVGEFSVDWNDVISVVSADEGKMKVEVENGDSLTGEIDVEELVLKTRWGRVTIPAKHVTAIHPKK